MFVRPSVGPVSRAGGYGLRQLPNEPVTKHSGVDFVGAIGSPIRAVRSGVVVLAAPNGALQRYGNVVVIRHDDPSTAPYSLYAHMSKLKARKDQRVKAGQVIGYMGNTGATTAEPNRTVRTHLHFELLKRFPIPPPDVDRVDPTPLLRAQPQPRAYGPALYPTVVPGQGPLLYTQATPLAGVFVDGGGDRIIWVVGLAALAWALLPHGGEKSW